MPRSPTPAHRKGWVTVSDLSEYAYCPRAFWYRHHPPAAPVTDESSEARTHGNRYHQRQLAVEVAAERQRDWWVVLALVAIGLVAAATLWWVWT